MDRQRQIELFSLSRLASYKDWREHSANLALIADISIRLGLLEIITRNKVALLLGIDDSEFISKQTLGYWRKCIDAHRLHNRLVNMRDMDFRKYSAHNKKDKMRDYQKVQIAYSMLRTIRNRAFHFENLLKTNANGTPRLSSVCEFGKTRILVGIDGDRIAEFLDDFLGCFDSELREYTQEVKCLMLAKKQKRKIAKVAAWWRNVICGGRWWR